MESRYWSNYNPVQVYFGLDVRKKLKDTIYNSRCLIITSERGRRQIECDIELKEFIKGNQVVWVDNISSNPCVKELQTLINQHKESDYDAIVSFGGGSSLDSGKVLSLCLSSRLKCFQLSDLLTSPELHLGVEPLPFYAVPTTSGTGSEVTPFATVWNHEEKKKYSLAGNNMFPKAAFIDPFLSMKLPLEPTINTGLDAINQAAESIWNKNASPISISYATRALVLGLQAMPKLIRQEWSEENRSDMSECSLLAGMAISHTRTALCHSISYPLTAHFDIPHGLACAFTMPAVLRLNLKTKDERFNNLKKALNTTSLEQIFDHVNDVLEVRKRVKKYVTDIEQLLCLVDEMYTPGRADNNLSRVDKDIILDVLNNSWFE